MSDSTFSWHCRDCNIWSKSFATEKERDKAAEQHRTDCWGVFHVA